MAKKNLEELMMLKDAITQIKKIKMGIQVGNKKLALEIDLAEHRLLDEYFAITSQSPGRQNSKQIK